VVVEVGEGVGDDVGELAAGDLVRHCDADVADDLATVAQAEDGRDVDEPAGGLVAGLAVVAEGVAAGTGHVHDVGGVAVAGVEVGDEELAVVAQPARGQRVGVGQAIGVPAECELGAGHGRQVTVARAIDECLAVNRRVAIGACDDDGGEPPRRLRRGVPDGELVGHGLGLGAGDDGVVEDGDAGLGGQLLEGHLLGLGMEAGGRSEERGELGHAGVHVVLKAAGHAVVVAVDAAAGADAAEAGALLDQEGRSAPPRGGDGRDGPAGAPAADHHVCLVGWGGDPRVGEGGVGGRLGQRPQRGGDGTRGPLADSQALARGEARRSVADDVGILVSPRAAGKQVACLRCATADEVVETRATDRIETRADAGHHSVLHEAPPFAQFAQHAWECQARLPYVVRADPQPDGHLAGPQRGTHRDVVGLSERADGQGRACWQAWGSVQEHAELC